MSNQITSPIGIPSELNFQLPSSMVPSRKFELRVQPYGQSTFTTAGQAIRIVLPQMQRTLFNFQTGYLLGNINFTYNGVVNADYAYVLGSWYSLFSRQVIRSGSGYVLETIENPGQLVNAMLNMTLNPAERTALTNSLGFDSAFATSTVTNNIAVKLNANAQGFGTNLTHTFAIPLIGILNNAKMVPAWNNGDLEIELTLASLTDYIKTFITNANSGVTGFSISGLEYVVECLELSPESYKMVMAQNAEQVVIKTQSYSFGSASLASGAGAGSVDIPFQIKVNSLKQLIWYASPTNVIDGIYGGVNPNLQNWQFIVNGISYPQRPIQVKNPSEAYMQIQKSFGSIYSASHSGSFNRASFCVASTAYNNSYLAYDNALGATDLETKSHKFYQCLDLETVNSNKESLYSGISTNGTTAQLRLTIESQLAAVEHRVYFWSCQDVMLVFDMVQGITSTIQ